MTENMKKITYIFACLLVAALASCNKALDQAPDGKISLDEVFADNDKTMYYLNSCYSSIHNKGLGYFFWTRGPVNWCDDSWDGDDLDVNWASSSRLYKGDASASNHPVTSFGDGNGNHWANYFARIRNCAVFLQNIPNANVNNEADRSRWTAEAHLLRAYYYTELLLWFGTGLPLVDEPYGLDTDFATVEKASYYETVKFIMKDCDAALECPELPWRIENGSEVLRVTKALAWAIKARVMVFAASPLYNDGENHWEEAYQVCKQAVAALEGQGYKLYTTAQRSEWKAENAFLPNAAAQAFNEYFCNSQEYSASPNDMETIYQLQDGGNWNVSNVDCIGAIQGYKTGTCPSQELVDAFETIDGEPILDLTKPYLDEETHLKPNYNKANTMYDPQNPYANRDPRFYATIYYNGAKRYCKWGLKPGAISFENAGKEGKFARIIATWCQYEDANGNIIATPEPTTGQSLTGRTPTRTGYFERKFAHPNEDAENPKQGARHKDYRLAETYLFLAEAANESGHTDDALTYLNKVRNRVGMPAVTVTDQAKLRDRIKNERRVEFALEGQRYFDVRRWHKPGEDLSTTDHYITAAKITHMNDGSYKYDRQIVGERLCWESKFLTVPIPASEVSNMEAITGENWQNDGWQ